MITTAHFVIGGAVGVATGDPVAALVAGVASHFVADMVPHLDVPPSAVDKDGKLIGMTPYIWTQVLVDGFLALAVTGWLWTSQYSFPELSPFVLGALGGFLPDLVDNVPFWKDKFRSTRFGAIFHMFHEWTHKWRHRFPMQRFWLLGLVTQVVAVTIALTLLV